MNKLKHKLCRRCRKQSRHNWSRHKPSGVSVVTISWIFFYFSLQENPCTAQLLLFLSTQAPGSLLHATVIIILITEVLIIILLEPPVSTLVKVLLTAQAAAAPLKEIWTIFTNRKSNCISSYLFFHENILLLRSVYAYSTWSDMETMEWSVITMKQRFPHTMFIRLWKYWKMNLSARKAKDVLQLDP